MPGGKAVLHAGVETIKHVSLELGGKNPMIVFGDVDPAQYDAEAEERWGDTDAWAESRRRVSTYDKDDWLRIKAEAADVERSLAEALRDGVPADSAAALDLAEEHRQHISRWFYDCSPEVHAGLGEMYVADERFTATYDAFAPGLAPYLRDAIRVFAEANLE